MGSPGQALRALFKGDGGGGKCPLVKLVLIITCIKPRNYRNVKSGSNDNNIRVTSFKGIQLLYKRMQFIPRVSSHAGQNRLLYLSGYGRLPGTL